MVRSPRALRCSPPVKFRILWEISLRILNRNVGLKFRDVPTRDPASEFPSFKFLTKIRTHRTQPRNRSLSTPSGG